MLSLARVRRLSKLPRLRVRLGAAIATAPALAAALYVVDEFAATTRKPKSRPMFRAVTHRRRPSVEAFAAAR
jgi:hypothetical protein